MLQDEGTVKNDQGTVQYDQVQVSYCHITAPISGRVGLRLVDPGNVVQSTGSTHSCCDHAGATHYRDFHSCGRQPGSGRGADQTGKHLSVDAFDRRAEDDRRRQTSQLDNQIDTTTGTVKMRALFDNKDGALFPNQFVNARLLVDTEQGATLIPTSAIQHNGQTAFVYLIQNDTAQIRNIQTGVTDGGNTAVTGHQSGRRGCRQQL